MKMNKANNQRQILFLFKAIATVVILLNAIPTLAGEYQLLREGDPTEKAYFLDTTGVCSAMEQNLKKFQGRPYGMACKRELDPALGFGRPTWERLDVMQHMPLVVAVMRYNHWDKDFLSPDSKQWPSQIKELVDQRQFGMELTRVDINGDGRLVNLLRFGFERPCEPKDALSNYLSAGHRHLYVVDATLSRIDTYSERLKFSVYDDVFMFNGKVYTDTFEGTPRTRNRKRYDGELKIFEFSQKGIADICTFHYFDTVVDRGGK